MKRQRQINAGGARVSKLRRYTYTAIKWGLGAAFALGVVVPVVAALPKDYTAALTTVGSLALLGVTGVYVMHTRRQANVLEQQLKAQISASRLSTLRSLYFELGEFLLRLGNTDASIRLAVNSSSVPGILTFPGMPQFVEETIDRVDLALSADVTRALDRASLDLPQSMLALSDRTAKAARAHGEYVTAFVRVTLPLVKDPDDDGRSNEILEAAWDAAAAELSGKVLTWSELSNGEEAAELHSTISMLMREVTLLIQGQYRVLDS